MDGLPDSGSSTISMTNACIRVIYCPRRPADLSDQFAASNAHLHLLAEAWFGVGIISWLLVGSIVTIGSDKASTFKRLDPYPCPRGRSSYGRRCRVFLATRWIRRLICCSARGIFDHDGRTTTSSVFNLRPTFFHSGLLVFHVPHRRDRPRRRGMAPDREACGLCGTYRSVTRFGDPGYRERCGAVGGGVISPRLFPSSPPHAAPDASDTTVRRPLAQVDVERGGADNGNG